MPAFLVLSLLLGWSQAAPSALPLSPGAPKAGAPPAAPDAVLSQVQDSVQFKPKGQNRFRDAFAGTPLSYGDELQTLEKGSAHVVFANGDAVLVKPGSRFVIEGNSKKTLLNFSVGEFLIGLKRALKSGQSFKVKTPAAVAAVRGTLFWGLSDENKDSTYACFGHLISVTAKGKTVKLGPGQTVKISLGEAPQAPKRSKIGPNYLDTFAIDGQVQGLKELVEKPH